MNCESRVALIGIVVSDPSSVTRLNEYLHECAHYIIGRMGVPYEKAGVSIISVAIDAPQDVTVEQICGLMAEPIPWAPGLILRGAGFESSYYMKD